MVNWALFLASTLIAIAIQGVFVLFEMASVSFNKVRLQYYVSRGKKRAIWLNYLLKRPSRLFGTTLIGINVALQIGSECSRRFYESIHLDPDWAPLSQIFIVVVFAELAPLFAARRHPEQAAMGLVPFMIVLARILAPVIWAFDTLAHGIHRLIGKSKDAPLFLSRDEVQMAFAEQEEKQEDEFSQLAARIFQLKNKVAGESMVPLARVQMAASTSSLADIRHALSIHYAPFILVYHRFTHNVVAIAHLRDLLKMEENRRILDYAKSPWFVAQATSVLEILNQFRTNNQSVAIILDASGQACGILTLDDIIEQIFGAEEKPGSFAKPSLHVKRTLSGEMLVSTFNQKFHADIPCFPEETLSDLIFKELDHLPAKDETVRIGSYVFTVLEPSMRGVKTLSVRTFQK